MRYLDDGSVFAGCVTCHPSEPTAPWGQPEQAGIGPSNAGELCTVRRTAGRILCSISCAIVFISCVFVQAGSRLNHLCWSVFWKLWKESWFWKKLTHLSLCFPKQMAHFRHLASVIPFPLGPVARVVVAAGTRWAPRRPTVWAAVAWLVGRALARPVGPAGCVCSLMGSRHWDGLARILATH